MSFVHEPAAVWFRYHTPSGHLCSCEQWCPKVFGTAWRPLRQKFGPAAQWRKLVLDSKEIFLSDFCTALRAKSWRSFPPRIEVVVKMFAFGRTDDWCYYLGKFVCTGTEPVAIVVKYVCMYWISKWKKQKECPQAGVNLLHRGAGTGTTCWCREGETKDVQIERKSWNTQGHVYHASQ